MAPAQNLAVANHFRQQKIRVVRLCVAYAVAVMHSLRNEEGTEYDDFVGLLPPDFARFFDDTGREGSFATSPERSYSNVTVSPADQLRADRPIVDLPSATTPLLNGRHRTVQLFPYSQNKKQMPLPLMWVDPFYIQNAAHRII
jgi:putative membrane protein